MKGLFDHGVVKACPVARISEVQLVVPNDTLSFVAEPALGKSDRMEGHLQLAIWDTRTGGFLVRQRCGERMTDFFCSAS